DIVRRATRADMREYPRYDVDMTVRLEVEGRTLDVRVLDISESGAKIGRIAGVTVGTQIALSFAKLHPVTGKIVRTDEDGFGVCFEPQKLKTEEVRRLVTAIAA